MPMIQDTIGMYIAELEKARQEGKITEVAKLKEKVLAMITAKEEAQKKIVEEAAKV